MLKFNSNLSQPNFVDEATVTVGRVSSAEKVSSISWHFIFCEKRQKIPEIFLRKISQVYATVPFNSPFGTHNF